MPAQLVAVFIAVTRCPGHHQLHICLDSLKRFHQDVASLLRRESTQKKNILPRLQTPFENLSWFPALSQETSIGYIDGLRPMHLAISLLQDPRNNHGSVGKPCRCSLAQAQDRRCRPPPFSALPI